jgi:hypothetical protein
VEPLIFDGELYLGMMWQSLKALDLLRDPRISVHSAVADRMAPAGEFKLHGRVREVTDAGERRRYGAALFEKIGWNPSDSPMHLFAVDIESAGFFVTAGDHRTVIRWRAGESPGRFRQGIDATLVPDGTAP